MARRRVEATEEKPSAAERTVPMFPEPGQASSAPPPPTSAPLGTVTPEQREQEIKKVQDGAIERARARRDLEKRAESEETGAVTSKELQEYQKELADERDAIVNEPPLDKGALGAGFFGGPPPRSGSEVVKQALEERSARFTPPSAPSQLGDEGEEVTCTKGEEMYGKPGQFSTYRVGPFSGTTRVRPGETRAQARRRLMDELNAFADEERETVKKKFLAHFPTAFS